MARSARDNLGLRVATMVVLVCVAFVAAAIFVLTEQTPDVTSAESSFVNDVLVSLFGGIPGIYDPETELWLGVHVRHWAHAAEFGVLGLFVALAALLVRWGKSVVPTAVVSLAVCACCSIIDQCHKLFVPGRHFDWFDLVMDAAGYCVAIALVSAIAALAFRKARGPHG